MEQIDPWAELSGKEVQPGAAQTASEPRDYAAMSAKKNAPRWIKQFKLIGKWPALKSAPATASA